MKVTSSYISAANAIKGKRQRRRIVAYVESYDDVLFWRTVLSDFEDATRYFEVMLPTRENLTKGKKQAIMQMLAEGGGECMIACVDADYDYLMQGCTQSSRFIIDSPYVFHTYAYSIENYQCYAPSLHNVCVMATLNDHAIFDFTAFLTEFSRIIFPLFVWNVWFYRRGDFHTFSMSAFNRVIELGKFDVREPEVSLDRYRHKVNTKIRDLRNKCHTPGINNKIDNLAKDIIRLGVTPETTYLYIQGHHLFDNIVSTILDRVCKTLRGEREREIRTKAAHLVQRQNELSAYLNAQTDVAQMLKKNTGYTRCPAYKRILADVDSFLRG